MRMSGARDQMEKKKPEKAVGNVVLFGREKLIRFANTTIHPLSATQS
jgi:hypothetical protein